MTSAGIRRATEEDVPVLVKIRNDAHAKKIAYGDYVWGKEGDGFSDTWVRHHLSQKDVYVVDLDGTLAGTFSLGFGEDKRWGPQEPIAGYVHGLCVRQGFNGLGLGSLMLDWCAHTVSSVNRRFVRLDCAVENVTLCAYYESLGFVRVGLKSEGIVWSLYEKPVHLPSI
ncbi:GCN5 family acetyltransferase [Burkholderia cepacia]|uniref:GCN5 family acetyltransferase n=1 Tax=Burkholderia cepacia TaxID=292 RepID=A0A104D0R8_BURCE|nr:GNAT family N-acetyltransferase [Burkholderia cepacia]KVK75238.1 GCN5 family acetyltransferase [Burkholderia cepacia]KVL44661.1 GCN5 family acetyltransferase [Burkholderia cepacia]